MHFDFAALLVILTVLTGGIWAADALFFRRRRAALVGASVGGDGGAGTAAAEGQQSSEPVLVEYARSFFPVILAVLILRSFLVEPFRIPSSSMVPTLLEGDFILVNKFSYGLRLPVVNYEVLELGAPERGDVVVFRYPEDPSLDYIKRVIGVPGDRIEIRGKRLFLNGDEVVREGLGRFVGEGRNRDDTGRRLELEKLPGRDHRVLIDPEQPGFGNVAITVPDDAYFVLGDNRDHSKDSRYWGFVPEDHLVGRAFFIWMHWDPSNGFIGWKRLGESID